jgi:hypothetical protein
MNYLVETKTEYTTQLTNILVPLIYDGISSIYEDARKVAKNNEELKIFQSFLKKVPKWNKSLLENEASRILTMSGCSDLLQDLINAVIKSNIMILTNTPPQDKHKLQIKIRIEFVIFIHNCYIETARIFYNNPYLFYHNIAMYDLKRNQREAFDQIKNSIIEAIRKMLPLKLILQEYLGNSFKENKETDFDQHMSEVDKSNLNTMLNVELNNPNQYTLIKKIDSNIIGGGNINEQKIEDKDVKDDPKIEDKDDLKIEGKQTSEKSRVRCFDTIDKLNQEPISKPIDRSDKSSKTPVGCNSNTPVGCNSNTPIKPIQEMVDINDPEESASYYKKPTIEDSFSNKSSTNPRQIFLDKFSETQSVTPIKLSQDDDHNESFQNRLKLRRQRPNNVSKFYNI